MLHVCGHSLLQVEGFDPYTGVTPSGWNVCFKCELCSPLHVCAYQDMHGQEFNLHTLCKPQHYWRRQQVDQKSLDNDSVRPYSAGLPTSGANYVYIISV